VDPALRIVTRLPLDEIWNDDGPLHARKGELVGSAGIRQFLRIENGAVVEAMIGERMVWHLGEARFKFWKDILRPHLVEPGDATEGFVRDDEDPLAFIVYEWFVGEGERVLVAEGSH
jgi:hypothetical protein